MIEFQRVAISLRDKWPLILLTGVQDSIVLLLRLTLQHIVELELLRLIDAHVSDGVDDHLLVTNTHEV
jgi:hypothetical protein